MQALNEVVISFDVRDSKFWDRSYPNFQKATKEDLLSLYQ